MRRALQKQTCIKIPDHDKRADVLRELGKIMYDRTGPSGDAAVPWATEKLAQLEEKFPLYPDFWEYMRSQWLNKVHMWVVGFRDLSYAGQDTNSAIERYHGYLKSVLKAERCRLAGRRVDWEIHMLMAVLRHYWYQHFRKMYGFIDNSKMQAVAVGSIIKARTIPDGDVRLPEYDGGPARVVSSESRELIYTVHNPTTDLASCTCVHAQRGNICKHQVKVLQMLRPDLAEGTIARYCGRTLGNLNGGVREMLNPSQCYVSTEVNTEAGQNCAGASTTGVQQVKRFRPQGNLLDTLRNQAVALIEHVEGQDLLMDHLHADFNSVLGRIKSLQSDIRKGKIDASASAPVHIKVNDDLGDSIVRKKDFLERGYP